MQVLTKNVADLKGAMHPSEALFERNMYLLKGVAQIQISWLKLLSKDPQRAMRKQKTF